MLTQGKESALWTILISWKVGQNLHNNTVAAIISDIVWAAGLCCNSLSEHHCPCQTCHKIILHKFYNSLSDLHNHRLMTTVRKNCAMLKGYNVALALNHYIPAQAICTYITRPVAMLQFNCRFSQLFSWWTCPRSAYCSLNFVACKATQ